MRVDSQHTHSAGFTLIELMMVIVIIMIMVTLAMPNVMKATQHQPTMQATQKVMDSAHYAKNRAVNDFRAYALQIVPYISDELVGEVRVHRGTGPQCSSVDVANGAPIKTYSLDEIFPLSEQTGGDNVHVRILTIRPQGLHTVCFTPDGRMVNHTTNQPIASELSSDYGAGDGVIVVQRFTGGVAVSQRHNVILPFSGRPRFTYGDDKGSKGEGGA
jgi:prepilin-type N-terminal cleavage/methylation domain-containing protein